MPTVQYASGCYADATSAAAAMAAGSVGNLYAAGSRLLTITDAAVGPGAADVTLTLQDIASADPAYSVTLAPDFQPCSMLDWEDGLAIGWGIGAIWIVCAAILFALRGMKGPPA